MNDLGKILSHLIERDIILSIIKNLNYYSKRIPLEYYDINFKKAMDKIIDIYGGVIIRDDEDIYYQINFNNNFNEYNEMVIINRLNELNEKYNFDDYEQFFNEIDDEFIDEQENEINIQQSMPVFESKKTYPYNIEEIYTSINRIERIINNKLSNKLREHNNKFNIIMENVDSLNNMNNNIEKIVTEYISNELFNKIDTIKEDIINATNFEEFFKNINLKIDNLLNKVNKIIEFNTKQQTYNEKLLNLLSENNIPNSIRNDISEYLDYYKQVNTSRNDIFKLIQDITKSNSNINDIENKSIENKITKTTDIVNKAIVNEQLVRDDENTFDDFINSLNNAEHDFIELTENIKTIPTKSNRRIKYDKTNNKKIIHLRNEQNNVYLDPKVKSSNLNLHNNLNGISTKSKGIEIDLRNNGEEQVSND